MNGRDIAGVTFGKEALLDRRHDPLGDGVAVAGPAHENRIAILQQSCSLRSIHNLHVRDTCKFVKCFIGPVLGQRGRFVELDRGPPLLFSHS